MTSSTQRFSTLTININADNTLEITIVLLGF